MANGTQYTHVFQLHHSPIVVVLAVEIVLLVLPAFAIQRASALAASQTAVMQLLIVHLKDVLVMDSQIAEMAVDELLAHHHF